MVWEDGGSNSPSYPIVSGDPMTTMLGRGVYSFREAARLTRLAPSRIREWFGNRRRVLTSDYAKVDGDIAISFYDLIDVFVVGNLRNFGVNMSMVRRAYETLGEELGTKHPFCHRELLTDGIRVFARQEQSSILVDVITKQGAFSKIIEPFLQSIDYDHVKLMAKRWRINKNVVIDPAICFGSPIVESVSVPTAILARAFEANDKDANIVAQWYEVAKADVLHAVAFERTLAA